jgi:predicted metalloprotease
VAGEAQAEDPCGGSLEGCFSYDEMAEYVNAVIPMVAQYFETHYEGVPAPRDIVYIPSGYTARSYCGVSNSQAYEYCTGDQTIYVGQDLIWAFYRQAGDAAPAVALAHEWGHHLQNMLEVPFARTQSQAIAFENQADCISGAWASYADDEGWLETDDDVADVDTLLQLIGSRESRSRDHGTSAERADAFESGFGRGIESCNAYFPDSPIG